MTERIPAGWYPDPAGLPQLRWWDNHQWTEHTSDAREPLVAAESETAARVAKESPAPSVADERESVVVTRETRSIASMVEDVVAAPAAAAAPRAAVDLGARFDAQLAGTPTVNAFVAPAATPTAPPMAPSVLHDVPQPSMTQPPVIVPPQPETIHVEPTIHRGFEPEPVFAGFGGSSVVDGESLGEALQRMFRTAR